MDGVKHKLDLVARFNEVSEGMAAPDADFDQLMAEQAELMVRRPWAQLGRGYAARRADGYRGRSPFSWAAAAARSVSTR